MIDDYVHHDALGLAELVASHAVTPAELLESAIERTEAIDGQINAVVIRWFDRARERAERGTPGGPFGGVPFLLKDLGAELEGTRLTGGSELFRDYTCDHDSEIVDRYRRAGLVMFGRTASPELGITTTTESRLHGKTRNPWHLEHTAGGSSGGAAAAVAAGIVPAAHASDGGGSIRIPASCCGLFGLKPSRGRVSAAPDRGEGWAGLSAQHAVSRSVRDSAALLDAVAGPATGDPYWAPPVKRSFLEETQRAPGRLRIALTTEPFTEAACHPNCVAAAQRAAKLCEELGHEVEEARPEIDRAALSAAALTIVGCNLRASLESRAAELGRTLSADDVEPLTWATAMTADEHEPWDYALAVDHVHAVGRTVGRFHDDYDVLLTPTMATPPLKLGVLALDNPERGVFGKNLRLTIGFTQLLNVAGTPAMSVPLAWNDAGLPIGIQFAAAMGREDVLFRLAAQLEDAAPWKHRRPPIEPDADAAASTRSR